jgi:lipopolysaccharide transport system ATP-binding protein
VLISVQGVAKRYPLVHRSADRLRAMRDLLLGRGQAESHTVLEGISLEVRRGESVGVIGENGAGKSTLLKLITGVLTPSEGRVVLNGNCGALLELGIGFHPEYSGRENLATAAALMGMSPADIRAKTDEIIDFADIGRYIDEPIKHYSTGMVVRLGFAIVAARRPDLLITDEVLAVGDESFQKKCVRWTEDYVAQGGTLLLVSHSMYHVQKLCRRALWLRQGRIERLGEVFEVTQDYLAYHERKTSAEARSHPTVAHGSSEYRVERLFVNGSSETLPISLPQGADLDLSVELYSPDGRPPRLLVGLVRADGSPVYGVSSEFDQIEPGRTGEKSFRLGLRFPALQLLPGQYELRAHALDPEGVRLFDTVIRDLRVRGESREFGMVRLPHEWS